MYETFDTEDIINSRKTAEILFDYLHDMIYKPSAASLNIDCLPSVFSDFGRGLQYLDHILSETRAFAKELAMGNLNCTLPPPTNEIASSLKMLHSSLKHLTWQAQQVAKGDYNQHVDFMGDFSRAFNDMIKQLEHRQQISLEEKTQLEMYVHLILANSPNPILLFDKNGLLVFASNSCFPYYKSLGIDKIIGKNINELLIPAASEETRNKIKQLYNFAIEENHSIETEQEINYDNHGSFRYFKIQLTPMLDINNIHRGVMVFLIDMTESVMARRESEKARNLAEQSSKSKTIFLAKMSHEIRTPMNAIIGMTELAMREDISPAAREHILTIKQASANLLSIINDILDFSKIETGKLEIIPKYYSIASLINDVVNIIRMRVIDTHIRFVVNIDNNIPSVLLGDEARIRQILLNILNNAVKYTKEGFVSLTIVGEKINNDTINIIFKVEDSGIGIKRKNIVKLFEEFTQFSSSRDSFNEGTGLGLAITRNIIEAMQGKIDVKSEYGKGSDFTITIPQKFNTEEKLAYVINPDEKNVLVYERREIYINSVRNTLNSLGVNYQIVSTDNEFDEKMKKNIFSHIIVSSVLYENIKHKITKQATIVLLTGFGELVSDSNLKIITMPVHSISVANILNGVYDVYYYRTKQEDIERFTARDAKVLVVDDIATNLKVAEGLLLPYRMQVDLCDSGLTAIEMVKARRYDMVFMDHMMPVMDGIKTTALIRALGKEDPFFKDLPIVALTANAVSGTREMFYENSFNDFLSKPIDIIELNTVLERWIPKEKQSVDFRRDPSDLWSAGSRIPGSPATLEWPEGLLGKSPAETVMHKNEDITIDGIDTKRGLTIAGGSIQRYVRFLSLFHKDCIGKINEIKKCLETSDFPLYTIHIHALKGACGNIGANEMSEKAKILEMAGKRDDFNFILANTPLFIADMEALLERVREVTNETKIEDRVETGNELKTTLLVSLKSALHAINSADIKKAVNGLRKYLQTENGEVIEKILENVLIGEYDEAIALIDSLL